ncbi:putative serine/threonine protein kinase [Blattamonas nauphoetae]|uniref:non-specific serine/threonine protein kinase n=1 Tax=Blattamonas nauphoetae TaxID=2049346 RepID=A0ABQ9XDE1_9EUKA|nr:putative serine/threonine protein kinase [Blattamonas nauphoetae]
MFSSLSAVPIPRRQSSHPSSKKLHQKFKKVQCHTTSIEQNLKHLVTSCEADLSEIFSVLRALQTLTFCPQSHHAIVSLNDRIKKHIESAQYGDLVKHHLKRALATGYALARTLAQLSNTSATPSQSPQDDPLPRQRRRSIILQTLPRESAKSVLSLLGPQQEKPLTLDSFEVVKPITRGAYGRIFLVKKKKQSSKHSLYPESSQKSSKVPDQFHAMKVLKRSEMTEERVQRRLQYEFSVLAQLSMQESNDYVVRLNCSFQTKENFYLIMDFLPGGDLFTLLSTFGYLSEEHAKQYLCEIILAVEFLHKFNIVHCDLKPDNILIGADGHLRLTDFGLSFPQFVANADEMLDEFFESDPNEPTDVEIDTNSSNPIDSSFERQGKVFTPVSDQIRNDSTNTAQSHHSSNFSRISPMSPISKHRSFSLSHSLSSTHSSFSVQPDPAPDAVPLMDRYTPRSGRPRTSLSNNMSNSFGLLPLATSTSHHPLRNASIGSPERSTGSKSTAWFSENQMLGASPTTSSSNLLRGGGQFNYRSTPPLPNPTHSYQSRDFNSPGFHPLSSPNIMNSGTHAMTPLGFLPSQSPNIFAESSPIATNLPSHFTSPTFDLPTSVPRPSSQFSPVHARRMSDSPQYGNVERDRARALSQSNLDSIQRSSPSSSKSEFSPIQSLSTIKIAPRPPPSVIGPLNADGRSDVIPSPSSHQSSLNSRKRSGSTSSGALDPPIPPPSISQTGYPMTHEEMISIMSPIPSISPSVSGTGEPILPSLSPSDDTICSLGLPLVSLTSPLPSIKDLLMTHTPRSKTDDEQEQPIDDLNENKTQLKNDDEDKPVQLDTIDTTPPQSKISRIDFEHASDYFAGSNPPSTPHSFTSTQEEDGPHSASSLFAAGTPDYIAPEVLEGCAYRSTFTVDWWAVGIIFFELLTGTTPFAGNTKSEVFGNVLTEDVGQIVEKARKELEEEGDGLSDEAVDFLLSILHKDPRERLGTKGSFEVKNHPLFEGVDWGNVMRGEALFVPVVPTLTDENDEKERDTEINNPQASTRKSYTQSISSPPGGLSTSFSSPTTHSSHAQSSTTSTDDDDRDLTAYFKSREERFPTNLIDRSDVDHDLHEAKINRVKMNFERHAAAYKLLRKDLKRRKKGDVMKFKLEMMRTEIEDRPARKNRVSQLVQQKPIPAVVLASAKSIQLASSPPQLNHAASSTDIHSLTRSASTQSLHSLSRHSPKHSSPSQTHSPTRSVHSSPKHSRCHSLVFDTPNFHNLKHTSSIHEHEQDHFDHLDVFGEDAPTTGYACSSFGSSLEYSPGCSKSHNDEEDLFETQQADSGGSGTVSLIPVGFQNMDQTEGALQTQNLTFTSLFDSNGHSSLTPQPSSRKKFTDKHGYLPTSPSPLLTSNRHQIKHSVSPNFGRRMRFFISDSATVDLHAKRADPDSDSENWKILPTKSIGNATVATNDDGLLKDLLNQVADSNELIDLENLPSLLD